MAISGSFKTSARYIGYRPDARGNARNWGVGADSDHDDRTPGPPGFPEPAPVHRLEVPPFIEDMFDVSRQPPNYGDADTETADYNGYAPVEASLAQHDAPTIPWGTPDNDRLRRISGAAHSAQKRVFPSQMATKVARGFMDRIETVRLQSLPQTPMGTGGPLTGQSLRALRGRNSLAVNNPGTEEGPDTGNYVRQGWEISRWTERPMRRRGLSHTKRELHVNTAEVGVEAPGLPGPYTSPFASFGSLRVGTARPGVRREPRPWDEDDRTDFTDDTGNQFVGGF
ncbi:hypothetical protein ACQPZP_14605 [Spirillospora sp. CA-142024]|uniref:hypothetical protein n=1 Tax=Spirillospora sp. CA-142024 TaxID=3240036 RepID=UPI003D8EEE99